METSLDLLTRAASLIEINAANRESAMKRNMEHQLRGSPPKYKRVCEHPGLPPRVSPFLPHPAHMHSAVEDPMVATAGGAMVYDMDSHKCAGTQTSFSSFPTSCLPPYPLQTLHAWTPHSKPLDTRPSAPAAREEKVILDLDQYVNTTRHLHMPPRPSSYPSAHESTVSDSNAPLNLTMSESQQSRPSVITRASSFGGRDRPPPPIEMTGKPATRMMADSAVYKSAIEEHFQRSLGNHYASYGSEKLQHHHPHHAQTTPMALAKEPAVRVVSMADIAAVSVTSSVDDHFEKSLGATWSKIKADNEREAETSRIGSVDEHFMKALGDTWLEIKAKQMTSPVRDVTASSSASPTHSHHTTSLVRS